MITSLLSIRQAFFPLQPYFCSHLNSLNGFSWAMIAVCLITFEIFFGQMYLLSLGIGAFAASIAMLIGANDITSVGIFVAVSLFSLLFARKRLAKLLEWKDDNATILGRTYIVEDTIPEGAFGSVLICGEKWQAFSDNGEKISKGACVEIVEVIKRTVVVKNNIIKNGGGF